VHVHQSELVLKPVVAVADRTQRIYGSGWDPSAASDNSKSEQVRASQRKSEQARASQRKSTNIIRMDLEHCLQCYVEPLTKLTSSRGDNGATSEPAALRALQANTASAQAHAECCSSVRGGRFGRERKRCGRGGT
jgi:hypothetical protein